MLLGSPGGAWRCPRLLRVVFISFLDLSVNHLVLSTVRRERQAVLYFSPPPPSLCRPSGAVAPYFLRVAIMADSLFFLRLLLAGDISPPACTPLSCPPMGSARVACWGAALFLGVRRGCKKPPTGAMLRSCAEPDWPCRDVGVTGVRWSGRPLSVREVRRPQ